MYYFFRLLRAYTVILKRITQDPLFYLEQEKIRLMQIPLDEFTETMIRKKELADKFGVKLYHEYEEDPVDNPPLVISPQRVKKSWWESASAWCTSIRKGRYPPKLHPESTPLFAVSHRDVRREQRTVY